MAKKKVPSQQKVRGNVRAKKDQRKPKPRLRTQSALQQPVRKVRSKSPRQKDQRQRSSSPRQHVARTKAVQKQQLPRRKVRKDERRVSKSRARVHLSRRTVRPVAIDHGEFKSLLAVARRHLHGYSAVDGWSLRALAEVKISAQRIGTLRRKVRELRVLLAQPHDLIKVPTIRGKQNRKARRELYKFTHQKIRHARHFIVHKPAHNFTVSLDRYHRLHIKGTFDGTVRGKRRKKVVTDTAFFLFDHVAEDEQDAIDMLEYMLPDMPEGFYVVLTGQHGDTGEPVEKGKLLTRLRTYIHSYQTDSVAVYDRQGNFTGRKETDTGFVQAITGFRHLSTTVDGLELQMQARDSRRRATEDFNARLKKERLTSWERKAAQDEERRKSELVTRQGAAKKAAATKGRKMKTHKFQAQPGYPMHCRICGKIRGAKIHKVLSKK